jgi:hypothetical protein
MLSPELTAQVLALPSPDRRALLATLVTSLTEEMKSRGERAEAVNRMRGLLQTEQPAPTDTEVAALLAERRSQKYCP